MAKMSTMTDHSDAYNPNVVLVLELRSGITLNTPMLRHDAWVIIDKIARPGSERFIKLDADTVVAAAEILMARAVEHEAHDG